MTTRRSADGRRWSRPLRSAAVFTLMAALLAVGAFTPAARGSTPPSAEELFARSGQLLDAHDPLFVLFRMTMQTEGGPDLAPFVAEMRFWFKGDDLRLETRMPEVFSDAVPPGTLMSVGGAPACRTTIVRADAGLLYCETMDGGWQTHDAVDAELYRDAPYALSGTPAEAGLTVTDVAEDAWNGQPAWRIDGVLDDLLGAGEWSDMMTASASFWVDRQSYLLLASESRLLLPAELTGGMFGGFTILMELVEFETGAHIEDELFLPPPGHR